jgi:cation transport protein ChaC
MSLLTRQSLVDGTYLREMARTDVQPWDEVAVDRSLAETLAARDGKPVWVFAYGSLMWNPLLATQEQQLGTLHGWRRSFCLCSVSGRGTPESPGRVLSLQAGGRVDGLALRLGDTALHDELRLLWTREMAGGCYRPIWAPVALRDGRTVRAIAFAADVLHPQHAHDDSPDAVARVIRHAAGRFGANADYLEALGHALDGLGLRDAYVERVRAAARALSGHPEGAT